MPFPALLAPILLGAGVGALSNPDDPLKAGLIGGAVGGLGAAAPNPFQGGGLLSTTGAGSAPIVEQGSQLALPSVASEMAGTAGGVADLGQALQFEKAQQAAALLPQDTPGFTSKLATGLLSNAGSFVPPKESQQFAPAGSLPQGQAPMPNNLFMQFNRRRR